MGGDGYEMFMSPVNHILAKFGKNLIVRSDWKNDCDENIQTSLYLSLYIS